MVDLNVPLTSLSEGIKVPTQQWERQQGRYVCLERHSTDDVCNKDFASKQALEAHRARAGCEPAKLPTERRISRLRGLSPDAAHNVKQQSNHAAVSKYRSTLKGARAVFRARHVAKYRALSIKAVPPPPEPEPPHYMLPPISWLVADAQFAANEVKARFASGNIQLSHSTWSLRFHPDKVQVRWSKSCLHSRSLAVEQMLRLYSVHHCSL